MNHDRLLNQARSRRGVTMDCRGARRSMGARAWPVVGLAVVAALAGRARADAPVPAPPSTPVRVQHRFLAVDESRAQLHYVDEADPTQDWTLKFPERCRDIQCLGKDHVLVTTGKGYREYDLSTREPVKDVRDERFHGSASLRRLPDGRTLLGCNQKGLTFFELDPQDKILRTATFPQLNTLRLMRPTATGTLLFGANTDHVIEADLDGHILRDFRVDGAKHIYEVLPLADGHLLVSTGYGACVRELDAQGNIVRTWGGKPEPVGLFYLFFADMQLLPNGHVVVCNWTGHGAQDSTKSPQLLEFDSDGRIVWSWHNAERAGTLHGIVVLDQPDAVEAVVRAANP